MRNNYLVSFLVFCLVVGLCIGHASHAGDRELRYFSILITENYYLANKTKADNFCTNLWIGSSYPPWRQAAYTYDEQTSNYVYNVEGAIEYASKNWSRLVQISDTNKVVKEMTVSELQVDKSGDMKRRIQGWIEKFNDDPRIHMEVTTGTAGLHQMRLTNGVMKVQHPL